MRWVFRLRSLLNPLPRTTWESTRALLCAKLLAALVCTAPVLAAPEEPASLANAGMPPVSESKAAQKPSDPVATPSFSSWEDWFYGQRKYGLGYIPDDALPRAIQQRTGMTANVRYRS